MPVNTTETILASAVQFLLDGKEYDAADALVLCEADVYVDEWENHCIDLRGPRLSYDRIRGPLGSAVGRAFTALGIHKMDIKAQLITIDPGWRTEFRDAAKGAGAHNQAPDAAIVWKNLRFRSVTELRVAQALDDRKVLFWPNCRARVGETTRHSLEVDLLVCHKGRFGILEVDGPHHTPRRAVWDHSKDRLFQMHGILIAQHFDGGRCFENADGVVEEFLKLLEQAP
jgi:hypothetical protein